MSTILVTGATGNVGEHVVQALMEHGERVVVAGSCKEHLSARFGENVRAVTFDFRKRVTWATALDGVERMFLMRPPAIADVTQNINPFVGFARSRGVDHIVFLSVAGAEKNKLVPHRAVEDYLRAHGDRYTNLRPGFFAQNLGSAYRKDIVEDDRIYVPAGRAPVNWIDVRDVAEVAARILCAPEAHRAQSYTLAGPTAVPWSAVTDALTLALKRPIRYEPASVFGYARHLARRGVPKGAIFVQSILHFLLRFGQGATIDLTLERLLGRPGRSVQEYINDHAQLWAKSD